MTLCFILSCSVFNVLSLVSLVECSFILPSISPFVKLFLYLFLSFFLFASFFPSVSMFFILFFFYFFPFLWLIYCVFTAKEDLFSGPLIKIIYHLFLFVLLWILFRSISLFFSTRIYFTFFSWKTFIRKKNSCLDKQLFLTY